MAIVELALVIPLLVLMSAVVVEIGRALYQYNTLAKSVRDAARYLAMQTPGTQVAQARNLVLYGNTAGTGPLLVPGMAAGNVPDPSWQTAGATPIINTVTVQVSGYSFQPLFTSAFGANFPALTFGDIRATMRSFL